MKYILMLCTLVSCVLLHIHCIMDVYAVKSEHACTLSNQTQSSLNYMPSHERLQCTYDICTYFLLTLTICSHLVLWACSKARSNMHTRDRVTVITLFLSGHHFCFLSQLPFLLRSVQSFFLLVSHYPPLKSLYLYAVAIMLCYCIVILTIILFKVIHESQVCPHFVISNSAPDIGIGTLIHTSRSPLVNLTLWK